MTPSLDRKLADAAISAVPLGDGRHFQLLSSSATTPDAKGTGQPPEKLQDVSRPYSSNALMHLVASQGFEPRTNGL